MKVELFKKLIKEAVREVLIEELGTSTSNEKPQKSNVQESKVQTQPISVTSGNPIQDALLSTMKEFSRKDYSNFLLQENTDSFLDTSDSIEVGLDLTNLDFVKKASSILKLSDQKDKLK